LLAHDERAGLFRPKLLGNGRDSAEHARTHDNGYAHQHLRLRFQGEIGLQEFLKSQSAKNLTFLFQFSDL
jgi:hypothetical protein